MSGYWMKKLLAKKKKCKCSFQNIFTPFYNIVIKNSAVKIASVPHYETLTIKKMFNKFGYDSGVAPYLPDERELYKLPRDWVISVIFTIKGEAFTTWVKDLVDKRDDAFMDKKNQYIEIDPEFLDIFKKSKHASGKLQICGLPKNFSYHYL